MKILPLSGRCLRPPNGIAIGGSRVRTAQLLAIQRTGRGWANRGQSRRGLSGPAPDHLFVLEGQEGSAVPVTYGVRPTILVTITPQVVMDSAMPASTTSWN